MLINIQKTSKKLLQIITGLVVVLALTFVSNAFTEPSQAPPSGNVSAPLNTSGAAQTKTGTLTFPFFYDYNNTGYYVDPNSTSRINYGIFDNIYSYGWIQSASSMYSPILYDFNDPGYYVDPNSTSRLNEIQAERVYGFADIRSPIFYDYNNTGYYVDPNSTSRLSEIQADRVYGFADIRSPIFYDYNDTGYYVDPNSTSRLNEIQAERVYGFADIRSPIFYDYNNTGYYVDPAGTSHLTTASFDGNITAESNSWGSCYWTAWFSKSPVEINPTCNNGYYQAGTGFKHNAGENWTYQESVRLYCCGL